MHPVHDIDALLLLAMTVCAKRRPAALIEIVAAAELLAGAVPAEAKLGEALQRLAGCGLIGAVAGAYGLTPEAQKMMLGQGRKADTQERLTNLQEKLAAYAPQGELPALALSAAEVRGAILAHRAAAKTPGRNLLLPKPKATHEAKPGQRQRKPLPARRRQA
jgi:hypothetical protein